ncbi:DUF1654 domain-containing protein, partial [Pseudomonas savastanoi]
VMESPIRSQSAQEARSVVIYKHSDEDQRAWDQIIAAINETEGVYVNIQSDGAARISWYLPETLHRPELNKHMSKIGH